MQDLNSNKAPGHDGIPIRMLKICGPSVIKSFALLLNDCLRDSVFANDWEKENVFPVFKKGNKKLLSNYHPIPLFPICSKIFKKNVV